MTSDPWKPLHPSERAQERQEQPDSSPNRAMRSSPGRSQPSCQRLRHKATGIEISKATFANLPLAGNIGQGLPCTRFWCCIAWGPLPSKVSRCFAGQNVLWHFWQEEGLTSQRHLPLEAFLDLGRTCWRSIYANASDIYYVVNLHEVHCNLSGLP